MEGIDFSSPLESLIDSAASARGTNEDDAWLHTVLPAALLGRTPPHLTQSELSRVMRWKLKSGKMRPNLQKFIDSLGAADVQRCSQAAFAALPLKGGEGLKAALRHLCELKGVGPATASLVLSLYQPTRCAFMSDEALLLLLGEKKYTERECVQLTELCAARARELGPPWTAQRVQRCIWASQVIKRQGGAAGAGSSSGGAGAAVGGKKRKRSPSP
jgi:hypothetical protein